MKRIGFIAKIVLIAITTLTCCKKEDQQLPWLWHSYVSSVTMTSANIEGSVFDEGSAPVTERGFCWSLSANPTIEDSKSVVGKGEGTFSYTMNNLTPNSLYYIRSFATSRIGTSYGWQVYAKTKKDQITDIDGNRYLTVQIDSREWLAENLKTTRFNDGTSIPMVSDSISWWNLSSPAYCWYKNDITSNKDAYGALYNWFAVNTGKLCPVGWHVPSDAEWQILYTFLGGSDVAGAKMKESDPSKWDTRWINLNNLHTTNESGFTGLPAGARDNNPEAEGVDGEFRFKGYYGMFSTSTESSAKMILPKMLTYGTDHLGWGWYDKRDGFSVRCVR